MCNWSVPGLQSHHRALLLPVRLVQPADDTLALSETICITALSPSLKVVELLTSMHLVCTSAAISSHHPALLLPVRLVQPADDTLPLSETIYIKVLSPSLKVVELLTSVNLVCTSAAISHHITRRLCLLPVRLVQPADHCQRWDALELCHPP